MHNIYSLKTSLENVKRTPPNDYCKHKCVNGMKINSRLSNVKGEKYRILIDSVIFGSLLEGDSLVDARQIVDARHEYTYCL